MKETLQTSLDDAALKFGVNIDWNSANIPSYVEDIFNRFVDYYTTAYTIVIVIFASMALISIGILLWILICYLLNSLKHKDNIFFKGEQRYYGYWKYSTRLCDYFIWTCSIILLLSFIVLLCAVPVFIKIKTIPEVMFINYLM